MARSAPAREARHHALLAAVIVLALTEIALGQRDQGFPIRGVVVGALDGAPAEGVTVTLIQRVAAGQNILNASAVTESDGTFVLRAPTRGEYDLSAFRAPSGSGLYGRDAFTATPQKWFPVSGPTAGLVIKLWEGPKVTGVVRDGNGEPIAGAVVRPLQLVTIGGRDVLQVRGGFNRTDAAGRYALQLSAPGRYVMSASPWPSSAGPAVSRQYYPGASSPGSGTPVDLALSRTVSGIDFQLVRARGFVVSGMVDGAERWDGPLIVELYAASEDAPTNLPIAVTTPKAGRFMFSPVVPGSYELRFVRYPRRAPGAGAIRSMHQRMGGERLAPVPAEPTWWAAERVDLIDTDVVLNIRPREGLRVKGRIVFDGREVRPEADALQTRGIYLRNTDYPSFQPAPLGAAESDGSFATAAVPPGRYVLGMLDGFDGYQLESVTIGGSEVSGVSFDLRGDVQDAVLRFAPRTTAVTGRAPGQAGEERFVIVWPDDERMWSGTGTDLGRVYRAVTVDGSYRVDVFPGMYRIAARAGRLPANWQSPSFLRALMSISQRVSVAPGQTVVHNPVREQR